MRFARRIALRLQLLQFGLLARRFFFFLLGAGCVHDGLLRGTLGRCFLVCGALQCNQTGVRGRLHRVTSRGNHLFPAAFAF